MLLDNSYKAHLERRAHRNLHYLYGDHWSIGYHPVLDEFKEVESKKPGWRARLSYNDILQAVEMRTAKYMRDGRIWSPGVGTDDLEDKIFQRTASKVMHAYWQTVLRMDSQLAETLQWAMSSAVVFGHVYWDRTKGPLVETSLDDWLFGAEMIVNPAERQDYIRSQTNRFFQLFGQQALQARRFSGRAGDVVYDPVPIFEVGWYPFTANRWSDVRVWTRTVKKTIEDAAEALGVDEDQIRRAPSPSGTFARGGNDKWRNLYYYGHEEYDEDSVLVTTIFKTPCAKWPHGRQAIVLGYGDHGIEPTNLQNDLDMVPLVSLVERPIRGMPYGTCLTDQLKSAQEEIDTSLSQAADYRASRVAPTLVDFVGNESQKLSTKPGGTFRALSPQHIPQAIRMPDVPMDFFSTAELNRQWIARLGGVTTIDEGSGRDTETRSGRALNILRGQNDLQLIPFGKRIDEFVSIVGELVLSFIQSRVVTERIVHFSGDDNRMEVVRFRGADLRPTTYTKGKKTAIVCHAFSVIPKSPSELMSFLNMALTPGADGRTLLDPETDRNEILDILGMSNFQRVFDKKHLDRIKARGEMDLWESGQPVEPPAWEDDDETHIQAHIRWKKTDAYKIAVSNAPLLAMEVDNHVGRHNVNAARKMIEPTYLLVEAHVAQWMKTRGDLLAQLAQPRPGEDPKESSEFAASIVNAMLPMPLIGLGAPVDAGSSEKGRPSGRKSDKSEKQGVTKEQQNE